MSFNTALYAIQSVCGSHTYTQDCIPEITEAVSLLLDLVNNALPKNVIESLVNHVLKKNKLEI